MSGSGNVIDRSVITDDEHVEKANDPSTPATPAADGVDPSPTTSRVEYHADWPHGVSSSPSSHTPLHAITPHTLSDTPYCPDTVLATSSLKRRHFMSKIHTTPPTPRKPAVEPRLAARKLW
jgi:hypothetical protein